MARDAVERRVPQWTRLHPTTQNEYERTGVIMSDSQPPARQDNFYHRGYGYMVSNQRDREFLCKALNEDFIRFESDVVTEHHMYYLNSKRYGRVKIEMFIENYLITCDDAHFDEVAIRMLHTGRLVKVIGDRQYIWVEREHNYFKNKKQH